MSPTEIRSIRGSLSRAAFARLLGVTALTVLRWELPEGSKEARRPRPKMIEALRKLAADGIPAAAASAVSDEDDDLEDASEPLPILAKPRGGSPPSDDDLLLAPLLRRLNTEDWHRAEDQLMAALANQEVKSAAGRALATLGLAQVQILARLDVRAALTTLVPILSDAGDGRLPRHVAARAYVLGATLFGAPDSRVWDPGRANVYAARAVELLDPEDELHILVALTKMSTARFVGVIARVYSAIGPTLEKARSPLALCLAAEMRSFYSYHAGDMAATIRFGDDALARAEQLKLSPLVLAQLAARAHVGIHGALTPAAILALTHRARAFREGLPPSEAWLRLLAAEMEAYWRQGSFAEVDARWKEAVSVAMAGGIPLFIIVPQVARLCAATRRARDAEEFAQLLLEQSAHLGGRAVDVHVLHLRTVAALFATDQPRAGELADRLLEALDAVTDGAADYIVHDATVLYLFAHIASNNIEKVRAGLQRCQALFEQRPSLWHTAFFRRILARVHGVDGQLIEAKQKLESAVATFDLVEDVIQGSQCRMDLALVAKLLNEPDAAEKVIAAEAELSRYNISRPPVFADVPPELLGGLRMHRPTTLTERLTNGIERLSQRNIPAALVARELRAVLSDLFPANPIAVEGVVANPVGIDTWHQIDDGRGQRIRFGAGGEIDAEQHAALRALAIVATMAMEARPPAPVLGEPGVADIDPILPGFIAAAHATRQLKREIAQLSKSSATVLITGESGSGKEVVARAVHDLSARSKKPYVVFNCASVPRELFEGQLFGYKRGAFTGASTDSPGVIRAAEGGTLFLDEIGELPLDTQPKLLRFLENGEIFPLGEQKPRRVDVRVLAATHRDLGRLVRERTFREDLYYRLNVVPLHVPPLRERNEDVIALARLFIERLAPSDQEPPDLGADAVAALKTHTWPGNVRELRNVIERAMAYAPVPATLHADHLRLGSIARS